MFYLSNITNPTMPALKAQTSALSPSNREEAMVRYHMETPFKLELYTFHPEDEGHYFSMTLLAPDNILHAQLTHEEMLQNLEKVHLHRHDYFELMLVLDGNVYQIIENTRHLYTPGSCCLLNRNVFHTEEYSADCRIAFLDFSLDFIASLSTDFSHAFFSIERESPPTLLENFFLDMQKNCDKSTKAYIDFIPKQDSSWIKNNIYKLFDHIAWEILSPYYGSSYRMKEIILSLFVLLSDINNFENTPMQIGTDKESKIFSDITEYFVKSDGRFVRTELASDLHYSPDYLNKICKKFSGLSLYNYGMTYCMSKAATLLMETSLTTEEIAQTLGFVNRTNFYKQFRQIYNMTPDAYRKSNR